MSKQIKQIVLNDAATFFIVQRGIFWLPIKANNNELAIITYFGDSEDSYTWEIHFLCYDIYERFDTLSDVNLRVKRVYPNYEQWLIALHHSKRISKENRVLYSQASFNFEVFNHE